MSTSADPHPDGRPWRPSLRDVILMFLIGVGFLGFAVYLFHREMIPAADRVPTKAVVTEIVERRPGRTYFYDVSVRYTANGRGYKSKIPNYQLKTQVGDTISIYYDRTDPRRVQQSMPGLLVGVAPFLIIALLPLTILSNYAASLIRARRKRPPAENQR